ncbi:unnamed protein product [Onchocerca flexuosa]|uniref:LAM_G_DOMAIN domain-containing protein n=1 Tax=Onchocerca flexuosa TaxID=387005 RepID=A0A183HHT9_9BILA|nr:unnamed protein product [Onchocerca flexuosa]
MNDFILLLLSDSKLIFSFSLNGEMFAMEWKSLLEMIRSYKIRVTFLYNKISLAVDNLASEVFKLPPGFINHPFKLSPPIYLGNAPMELLRHRSLNNFTGCLSNIFINGRKISKSGMKFLGDIG